MARRGASRLLMTVSGAVRALSAGIVRPAPGRHKPGRPPRRPPPGCPPPTSAVQNQRGRSSSAGTVPSPSSRGRTMDLLGQAAEGFRGIDTEPQVREQALKYLRPWLTQPEFSAYRPQLEWLIRQQQ